MRAFAVCQTQLRKSLPEMHIKRFQALWFAVGCLLGGGRLTLTALGRAAQGDGYERHHIKRIDRLLGNVQLWSELPGIYQGVAGLLLASNVRPVVVVDWTPWREGFHALTAAIPVGGKCIPIYGEVHPERRLNSRRVHRAFLKQLATVLPTGTVPIMVTDSGFKSYWIDEVIELGWDYVARIRGNVQFQNKRGFWTNIKCLHAIATSKPANLGKIWLGRVRPCERRLVSYFKAPKKRSKPICWRRKPGASKRRNHANNTSTNDHKYRKSAKEPWILATSLTCNPREVVRIYSSRMQTEETYRGLKSHAYGWSFEDSRSTTAERLSVLLIIGTLATLVASALGWWAEQCALHRHYQAGTKRRRALSWMYLGMRLWLRQDFLPRAHAMHEAFAKLGDISRQYAPGET